MRIKVDMKILFYPKENKNKRPIKIEAILKQKKPLLLDSLVTKMPE